MTKLIRTLAYYLSIAILTTTTVSAAVTEIDRFDGVIGEDSSWFDASRWVQNGVVPTSSDIVWIDESDTYVCVDDPNSVASVSELVVGRSASSNPLESVQLDLLEDTKLRVVNEMYVGQYQDSEGLVYASKGSQIIVGSTLFLGPVGRGIVLLEGNSKLVANDLDISDVHPGSRILLDDEATIELKSQQLQKIKQYIDSGLIVVSNNNNNNGNKKRLEVLQVGSGTFVTVVDDDSVGLPEPTGAPTARPTTQTPTGSPIVPFVCEDVTGKVRFKKKPNANKTKNWKCKQIKKKKKCSLLDLKGNPLWHSCPVLCDKCDKLATHTANNNNNNSDNDNVFDQINNNNKEVVEQPVVSCEDDNSYRFKNMEERDCQWVWDNNKCETKDNKNKNIRAKQWCPSQCLDECSSSSNDALSSSSISCDDDNAYRFKNMEERDCQWVFDNNKCNTKDVKNNNVLAKEKCPSQCLGECSSEPSCNDDPNYRFKNMDERDCQWVFDNNKCNTKDIKNGNARAKEWCPSQCNSECNA